MGELAQRQGQPCTQRPTPVPHPLSPRQASWPLGLLSDSFSPWAPPRPNWEPSLPTHPAGLGRWCSSGRAWPLFCASQLLSPASGLTCGYQAGKRSRPGARPTATYPTSHPGSGLDLAQSGLPLGRFFFSKFFLMILFMFTPAYFSGRLYYIVPLT